jgi:predicted DNA-binding transcriptional regulator AlpA
VQRQTMDQFSFEPPRPSRRVLPHSLPPRGLSRVQAAEYIGVSPSLFDEMVKDGRMPKPKTINARKVWDRQKLDEAFAALPDEEQGNPWDA